MMGGFRVSREKRPRTTTTRTSTIDFWGVTPDARPPGKPRLRRSFALPQPTAPLTLTPTLLSHRRRVRA